MAGRLSPRQLEALTGRMAAFQGTEGPSKELKNEVALAMLSDLENPLKADNACGPTCSSTSTQMLWPRISPLSTPRLCSTWRRDAIWETRTLAEPNVAVAIPLAPGSRRYRLDTSVSLAASHTRVSLAAPIPMPWRPGDLS